MMSVCVFNSCKYRVRKSRQYTPNIEIHLPQNDSNVVLLCCIHFSFFPLTHDAPLILLLCYCCTCSTNSHAHLRQLR
ncbi:hypothetical protein QVD17_31234 [Tagetes erecta]|uniref:Uncharacterized protein n=1 Tax=Tagetes erecta TaxID=13708 RepID=A0AAD8K3Z1_TARER|nr:hypothetical protein QVD17_31234 [Tagetes erecta]